MTAQTVRDLIREVDDLPNPERTLLSQNERALIEFCQRLAQPLRDMEGFAGKFWLELREPRRVPEIKGPFPSRDIAKTLREFMAARPKAYISVVTIDYLGPEFEDAPTVLQSTDGRSMSRGSHHIQRVRDAHGDHEDRLMLVPAEATEAMWQAGREADGQPGDSYGAVWRAMVCAASKLRD